MAFGSAGIFIAMIDLHTHSTYSDGTQNVADLIEDAHEHKIDVLSLTDHDSIEGLTEAREQATRSGIKLVAGVEITTQKNGKTLHLLGYNFDQNNAELNELLTHLRDNRRQKMTLKLESLNELFRKEGKVTIDIDQALKDMKHHNLGTAIGYLEKHGFAKDKDEAAAYLHGITFRAPNVLTEDVIRIVHQAGGLAVLAHPLAPKISIRNITQESREIVQIITDLKKSDLDGLECFQSSHFEQDEQIAYQIARDLKLIVTAGSDWHGPLEEKGKSILQYIPRYAAHIGAIDIPPLEVENMLSVFK